MAQSNCSAEVNGLLTAGKLKGIAHKLSVIHLLFYQVLDSNQDDRAFHKKTLALLRYLSKLFRTLPSSFILNKVMIENKFPVAGGGFAVSVILCSKYNSS